MGQIYKGETLITETDQGIINAVGDIVEEMSDHLTTSEVVSLLEIEA